MQTYKPNLKRMQTYKPNSGQKKLIDQLARDNITHILAYSGSRSGKTFELTRAIIARALLAENSRHAIIRRHFTQAKKYIWLDTLPTVIDLCWPEIKKEINWDKSDFYITLPNNSEIWIGGLDDKNRADKILGGEYNTIFFNECSEITYQSIVTAFTRLAKKSYKIDGRKLINKTYFDENPPSKTHWSYKLFFENINPETRKKIPNPEQFAKIHLRPEDNIENLSENFIETLKNLTGKYRKRFYEGEFQEEIEGALWNEKMINDTRVHEFPQLKRVNVAIDPSGSTTGDETGITVQGEGVNGHFYVLDDLSGHYTPNGWADKAIFAFKKWRADRIIGERNYGGDLVESNILNRDRSMPVSQVWASRGKMKRAEPIAALYERGIVHHVGEFVDMEYELTNYTGEQGEVWCNRSRLKKS